MKTDGATKKISCALLTMFVLVAFFLTESPYAQENGGQASSAEDRQEEFVNTEKLAFSYFNSGDYSPAAQYFKKELEIARSLYGDGNLAIAQIYFNIGASYAGLDMADEMMEYFDAVYRTLEALGDADFTPVAQLVQSLSNIYNIEANRHYMEADYDTALTQYGKELSLLEKLSSEPSLEKARTYSNLGSCYYAKRDLDKTLDWSRKAADLYTAILGEGGYDENTYIAYNNMGLAYSDKSEFDKALDSILKALDFNTKSVGASAPAITATIYGNIGKVLLNIGKYADAIGYTQKALALMERVNGRGSVSVANQLVNIGSCYVKLGAYDKAQSSFLEALDIYQKSTGVDWERASCDMNLGVLLFNMKKYEQSLSYLQDALEAYNASGRGTDRDSASVYLNIGNVYLYKGDFDLALANFKRAEGLCKNIEGGKNSVMTIALGNIGLAYSKKRDNESALSYYKKSLALALEIKHHDAAFPVLNNIAGYYDKKGDYENSILYLQKALELSRTIYGEESPDTAQAYANLGGTQCKNGKLDEGIINMKRGLAIQEKVLPEGSFLLIQNYGNLGLDYYLKSLSKRASKSDLMMAKLYWGKMTTSMIKSHDYKDTIELINRYILVDYEIPYEQLYRSLLSRGTYIVERARRDMTSLRSEIMEAALPLYYFGVQFYTGKGDMEKAFNFSESLRSRGFLDQMGTETALNLSGVTEEEKKKIRELSQKIESARTTITAQNSMTVAEQDSQQLSQAVSDLSTLEKELDDLDGKIGRRLPAYRQLRNPQPVKAEDAMKWCGEGRAVLEYVIWDSSMTDGLFDPNNGKPKNLDSYCLIITSTDIRAVKLDGNYNYAEEVAKLHDSIAGLDREGKFELVRNRLYEKLVEPILPYMGDVKRLTIVPDGNLSILPFEVLRKDFDSPMLGEQYAVSLSPSISVSILANSIRSSGGGVLAFGGAWYDTTLTEEEHRDVLRSGGSYDSPGHWHDLPGTVVELETLRKDVFKDVPFSQKMQEEASEATIKRLSKEGVLAKSSILHFACHGHFNSGKSEEPSSLLFSEISGKLKDSPDDGYLTVPEAAVLKLNADMVCLSACETGLVDMEKGDGIVGLSRAFMVAGAKRIGVSLWEADDEAASAFMTGMYRKVVQEGIDYADAYRQVKAEFRDGDDWDHPFYWAVYTLYE